MSMAQLIVEVVDVNENNFAPVFDDFVAKGWVKENQDVTRVMQVKFGHLGLWKQWIFL